MKWVLDNLKGEEDGHKIINLKLRNCEPEAVGNENCYSKSIKPNLGGGTYIDHLILYP